MLNVYICIAIHWPRYIRYFMYHLGGCISVYFIGVDRGCIRVPPWRSLASVRSSCRRLKLAQRCAPVRGGQKAGCLQPRASCSSSTRRRSPARPPVSLSQRALPMVTRPRIGWDQLRLEVEAASRRGTGHAAAPPARLAVHPVSLAQLHRWPIRPSGAP